MPRATQARAGKTPAAQAHAAKVLRMFAESVAAAGRRLEPSVMQPPPLRRIVQSLVTAQKHEAFRWAIG